MKEAHREEHYNLDPIRSAWQKFRYIFLGAYNLERSSWELLYIVHHFQNTFEPHLNLSLPWHSSSKSSVRKGTFCNLSKEQMTVKLQHILLNSLTGKKMTILRILIKPFAWPGLGSQWSFQGTCMCQIEPCMLLQSLHRLWLIFSCHSVPPRTKKYRKMEV